MEAPIALRDPAERNEELMGTFLNRNVKFKSPEFILPTQQLYDKNVLIHHFNQAFNQLNETAKSTDLSGMIKHPAFGDITKLELLYFVLYHTMRHHQQMLDFIEILHGEK